MCGGGGAGSRFDVRVVSGGRGAGGGGRERGHEVQVV